MVGQGVAGTVTDAAGGIVEKTPLNKVSPLRALVLGSIKRRNVSDAFLTDCVCLQLTREKTIPEDGITKEQRSAAIRLQEIVIKHGRKQVELARDLAENGHQVMANVLMTMELLSIQKEAAGERFEVSHPHLP